MNNTLTKKRVIRDFDKLDESFQKLVLRSYPHGFIGESLTYLNIQGKTVAAIPFETEDTFYLLRLSSSKPVIRIKKDDYGEEYVHLEEVKSEENDNEESGYDDPLDYDSDYSGYEKDDDGDFYD